MLLAFSMVVVAAPTASAGCEEYWIGEEVMCDANLWIDWVQEVLDQECC